MGSFFAGMRIVDGPLPTGLFFLALVLIIILALRRREAAGKKWPLTVVSSLIIGAAVGLGTCWLFVDVFNAFDTSLSPLSRTWIAAAFAAIALALVNLRRSRIARKVGALGAIFLFALVAAVGVNAEFGQYTTIESLTGASPYESLPSQVLLDQKAAISTGAGVASAVSKDWAKPTDLPSHGIVGHITIPATVSHFAAREALVYLPPAALVSNPPALPVFVMLSGQPGSPDHVFAAGHIDRLFDAIAAQNRGLAPIVVVPDQLSSPGVNPMCVDSIIGNSATYLTVDVPNWIRSNLNVQSAASSWAIGGFSQGGTCSIQLGAGHPELFGSILDVSGELEPHEGSVEQTIAAGFAGNAAAYDAAKPLTELARRAPYADTVGVFAVGALDSRFGPFAKTIATAAQKAGMRTTLLSSPGTSHDWSTVRYAIENGMPLILKHMGLIQP